MCSKFKCFQLIIVDSFKAARIAALLVMLVVLGACNSQATLEAEQAAVEQERLAQEAEAARVAAEQSRMRAAEEERARQARIVEQRRLEEERRQREIAEQRRQQEIARAEAAAQVERERLAREEAATIERQRQQEQERVRAETERVAKLARIEELEAQIAAIDAGVVETEAVSALYQEAITVSEELINVLAAEQAKYESIDEFGNTAEPLDKDMIIDLEQRRSDLVRQAEERSQ